MLTSGGIITSLAASAGGPHPVYLYLAIGYGAFFCSWMNDSGFWLVSRLGGLTERQTLRTWTVMVSGLSLAGLALTWLGSRLLPLG
jgi:gluconate:H+ symporter, GntP family